MIWRLHAKYPITRPAPGGGGGATLVPVPCDRWHGRTPITASQRQRFRATREQLKTQVISEFGLQPQDLKRRDVRATVERTATRRALESLGFLFVSRGPVRPPLNLEKCHFIS